MDEMNKSMTALEELKSAFVGLDEAIEKMTNAAVKAANAGYVEPQAVAYFCNCKAESFTEFLAEFRASTIGED